MWALVADLWWIVVQELPALMLTKALGDRHPVRAVVYGPGCRAAVRESEDRRVTMSETISQSHSGPVPRPYPTTTEQVDADAVGCECTRCQGPREASGDWRKGRMPSDAHAAFITVPADRKPLPGALARGTT
jgi:hypothetical protein